MTQFSDGPALRTIPSNGEWFGDPAATTWPVLSVPPDSPQPSFRRSGGSRRRANAQGSPRTRRLLPPPPRGLPEKSTARRPTLTGTPRSTRSAYEHTNPARPPATGNPQDDAATDYSSFAPPFAPTGFAEQVFIPIPICDKPVRRSESTYPPGARQQKLFLARIELTSPGGSRCTLLIAWRLLRPKNHPVSEVGSQLLRRRRRQVAV